jgi:hypothetical protein
MRAIVRTPLSGHAAGGTRRTTLRSEASQRRQPVTESVRRAPQTLRLHEGQRPTPVNISLERPCPPRPATPDPPIRPRSSPAARSVRSRCSVQSSSEVPVPAIVMAHGFGSPRALRLYAYAERFAGQVTQPSCSTTEGSATAKANLARSWTSPCSTRTGGSALLRPFASRDRRRQGRGVGNVVRWRPRPHGRRTRRRAGRRHRTGAARQRPSGRARHRLQPPR